MNRYLIASVALAASVSALSANAAVIDFETTAMGNSPGAFVPVAAQLSNQYKASLGVAFSSGAGYAAVVCHCGATHSGQNIIGGTDSFGNLNYTQAITATFFNTADLSQGATTNFAKIWLDFIPLGSGTVTFQAFDAFGALIGTTSTVDNGVTQSLSFSLAGIRSVSFFSDNATVGFDDFEFGELTPIRGGAVPEPATWAMMIAGFGLVGATLRNRRRMAVVA